MMTDELRKKIQIYIKNRLDISPLIKDVSIKGENLSGAIIKDFNRVGDNISGCNLSRAIIGEEGKVTNISGTIARNCIFKGTKFLAKVFARKCNFNYSNFSEAFLAYWEYQYSSFLHCTFCDTVIPIGSRIGLGAIFDENLFKELSKLWNLEITVKPKSKEE